MTLDELNERFGIPGVVRFDEGAGSLDRAAIATARSEAHVYLLGGHVTHWRPAGGEDVLWVSRESSFAVGRPIRGGVPVCHPWFAAKSDEPNAPSHGYVRLMAWDVESVAQAGDGSVTLVLWTKFSRPAGSAWPGNFELRNTVTVGEALTMSLETRNFGPEPLTITEALHSYFRVSDVRNVSVAGLAGCEYFDKVAAATLRQGDEPVTFAGETDRVFRHAGGACVLDDSGLGRKIHIAKRGSRSTVVWNPWTDKARRMADFGDDEWPGMVCVETANALDDAVTIPPGGSHTMTARISLDAPPAEWTQPAEEDAAAQTHDAPCAQSLVEGQEIADWSQFTSRAFVRARAAAVFDAWATDAGLRQWLLGSAEFAGGPETTPRADGAARSGDALRWTWQHSGWAVDGQVLEASWPERLRLALGEIGCVDVSLTPEGDGTLVELRHRDVPTRELFVEWSCVWTFYLANLKSVLEGGLDLREDDPARKGVVGR